VHYHIVLCSDSSRNGECDTECLDGSTLDPIFLLESWSAVDRHSEKWRISARSNRNHHRHPKGIPVLSRSEGGVHMSRRTRRRRGATFMLYSCRTALIIRTDFRFPVSLVWYRIRFISTEPRFSVDMLDKESV
jgi:hypothetical protein